MIQILAKALFYLGTLIPIGIGLHFILRIHENQKWLGYAAMSVVAALFFRLFMLNMELAGGLSRAFDFSMFGWVWPSILAQTYAFIVSAALLAFASMLSSRILAALGTLTVAGAYGLSGHTQTLDGSVIAGSVVAIHVLVAGFWVFAPFSLWPRAEIPMQHIRARLEQFSKVAIGAIPLMVGLGLWLAWIIAGSLEALLVTPYGRVLLLKLTVVILALGAGAINKLHVDSQLATDEVNGRRILRRTLTAEVIFFSLAILFIAAATTVFGPHFELGS